MSLDAAFLGEPKVLYPIGLRSLHGKFLTIEKFGEQLNVNGPSLRAQQIWQLESDGQGKYSFRGPKDKYLSVDLQVKLTDAKAALELFTLEYKDGVVFIKNKDGKNFSSNAKGEVTVGGSGKDAEWELVINFHPQVCLITQKKYLSVEKGEVRNTRPTQFGKETMLNMEPADPTGGSLPGQFALSNEDGKFIEVDPATGNLSANSTSKNANCFMSFEFHGNCMAIKSIATQKYLASGGQTIKAIRNQLGPKEVFNLVDSDAQVAFKAFNGKWLSFQGTNLISNRDSVGNEEIFMLEFKENKWAFRTCGEVYVSAKDSLTVDAKTSGASELFDFEYHDGKVAIKSSNGKYLKAAPLGGVDNKGTDGSAKESLFEVYFFNRQQIVFWTSNSSFVGTSGTKVMANKSLPETFTFVYQDGLYAVKDVNGKYFKVNAGKVELADEPEFFILEFHLNKLALKSKSTGTYLKLDIQQGTLVAGPDKPSATELFEF